LALTPGTRLGPLPSDPYLQQHQSTTIAGITPGRGIVAQDDDDEDDLDEADADDADDEDDEDEDEDRPGWSD
jgi:hypothetical protein